MNHNSHRPAQSTYRVAKISTLLLAGALALAVMYLVPQVGAESGKRLPAPNAQATEGIVAPSGLQQTVVFAGGCFWGVQAVFQHTKGVMSAVSGYAGGKAASADYETVSGGGTGHAEAVQVTYDPQQVSYSQLLQIYFSVAHDPTQLNRQYPDTGTQYRSAVFTSTPEQKLFTERYIDQLDAAHIFSNKIVMQLNTLQGFYPAEQYHQNYATIHPEAPYIARFDLPKIANLKALMPELYREQAVLVAN